MFARFKNFVYRHKKKFIFSSVIIGGSILAVNYAHKKILEWQEKEALDFLKKTRKEQHYRSTERTCNQTIFSLSKSLKETIFRTLDSDSILQKIRDSEGSRVHLWEELKIVVFAQICTLLYAGLMLVVLLRVQLNIIGGFMVREDSETESLDSTAQEKYLSLCQHFLEKSISDLCHVMRKHSELILKDISLKQKLTLQDIENIFWRLESSLNSDKDNPLKNLPEYLMPVNDGNKQENDPGLFKNAIPETIEILQHHDVLSASESALKRAFSNTVDKIAEYYSPLTEPTSNGVSHDKGESSVKIVNVTDITVPLAKILPILHGLYKASSENGTPDPWIEQFVVMDKLCSLASNVYEAYSSEDIVC